jgi:pyruvate decarboxylase
MDARVGSVDGPLPAAENAAVGCPASAPGCSMTSAARPAAPVSAGEASLGRHLARRLVQVGVGDVFAVPGDFNLTLLDHLIAEPGLRLVGCCNELNAGYAADGYARARGVGACAVTFTVGGLSVLNAIAGAYSENLPVICIAGGPNSNDYGTNRILHHTIGIPDFSQELRCFQTITCHQVRVFFSSVSLIWLLNVLFACSWMQAVVTNLEDAHEQIDTAITTALRESKPVYLSISCNLPGLPHPTFSRDPVPFYLAPRYRLSF